MEVIRGPATLGQLDGRNLVAPRIAPALDPGFRPAALAAMRLSAAARESRSGRLIRLAIQQPSGPVTHHEVWIHDRDHDAVTSRRLVERELKFLLWSRGGSRAYVDGPESLTEALRRYYAEDPAGTFDARTMSEIYGSRFEVVAARHEAFPSECGGSVALGGHFDGCRIGFDLGASDRKVAAVIDGSVVFTEESAWNPREHADPAWHLEQIDESLRRAAEHLPRVDAIGGSSAGVFVDNEPRVASLFRAVPAELFRSRVRHVFHELQRRWQVPLVVLNDGEVTALAGAMIAGAAPMLGIAMGSSEAAGYVAPDGGLTPWLNELAFAPIDLSPASHRDEWSGDAGVGAQYFSQQAVARLLPVAGIEVPESLGQPEQLVELQRLMSGGDPRARAVYETIGAYLGYGLLQYARFYRVKHLLILGRVMTGNGGDAILDMAQQVLRAETPETADGFIFHTASERDKRHGQAVAAASLPPGS